MYAISAPMAFAAGGEVILRALLILVALGCAVFVAVALTGFFISLVERNEKRTSHERKNH